MLSNYKKSTLIVCVITILTACSNDSKIIKEQCNLIQQPPQENFDKPTLDGMKQAYTRLIKSCDNSQVQKNRIANQFESLAMLYLTNNLNEKAFNTFQSALTIRPNQFAWHYYSGVAQERMGNLDLAAKHYLLTININPQDIPTLIRLAEIYKVSNNQDQTHLTINKILRIKHNQPIALLLKAELLIEKEQYKESAIILNQLTKNYPHATKLNYILANALRRQGKSKASAEALKFAGNQSLVLKDPLLEDIQKLVTGAGGHLVLANKARKSGNLAVAKSHLLIAIKFEPKNVSVLHNLGYISGVEGNHKAAMSYLKKALDISPTNTDIASDYATALVSLKKYHEAINIYKSILVINPNDYEAKQRLNKIETFINSQK